ncbi:thioredoxin family protein [Aquimarina sp. MMG016]|uniref:thioredoxin family protein n=1 Tax=Aquimarina sp. MMG016 TaxID=2822690 RepID=UPI001B3A1C31|nr:thioredoxin family protein [Aquimarina sp. MMG016]MBQ4822284.1 thioredoxin family protein [Aquimarina sp. MMG016]
MRKIFLFTISSLLLSCGSISKSTVNEQTTSKNISKEPSTTNIQRAKANMLVGKQTRNALEQNPYGIWFNSNFENYAVDTETVKLLSPYLEDISIKAFMGTWCSDSKRETPNFYKILDQANFNYNNLELITVTRSKDTPEGYEKGLDIQRVPTFIFYKNGKEVGRYVEFARETLEKDILAILSGVSYKHSYED